MGLYIGCGGERGDGVTCTGTTWNMGPELKDCSNLGLYFGFCLRPFIGRGYSDRSTFSTIPVQLRLTPSATILGLNPPYDHIIVI